MAGTLADAVHATLERELASEMPPGLYLVATPIGNLSDITLRALCILARADHIFCEDTRQTQKLINHYSLMGRLSPYHDHNALRERPKILKKLAEGARIALVSDAGTPLISDPGYKLVREAAGQGVAVIGIPGASAVLVGLAVSGLPTDSFFFAGFLPPKEAAAKRRLRELAAIPATLILFETSARLDRTLTILGDAYPGRELVIARELTKRFEEVIRTALPADEVIGRDWKGEFVLMLSPPVAATADDDAIMDALQLAFDRSSLRDAVDEVRSTLHVPRKRVYELALQLQHEARTRDDE